MTTTVHLLEPSGEGGIFQHTVELARTLDSEGFHAVVHTAKEHERLDGLEVEFCPCSSWHRSIRFRPCRLTIVIAHLLLKTVPHLLHVTRGQIIHVQGLYGRGLYGLVLLVLRPRSHQLIFSPHNTFVRQGHSIQVRILRWAVRSVDIVVCFSQSDVNRLRALGARDVIRMPLVQYVPQPSTASVIQWRTRLGASEDRPLILLPGQIRPDKGGIDFIEAQKLITTPSVFAIVGSDTGFAAEVERYAADNDHAVRVIVGFLPLMEFAALLAAADIVVAPYAKASSSGVVAVAEALGTPAIAYPVGGLTDSTAILTQRPDPHSLAKTLEEFLTGDRHKLTLTDTPHSVDWILALYQEPG